MEDRGHQRPQLPSKHTKAAKQMYFSPTAEHARSALSLIEFDGYGTIAQQDQLRALPLQPPAEDRTPAVPAAPAALAASPPCRPAPLALVVNPARHCSCPSSPQVRKFRGPVGLLPHQGERCLHNSMAKFPLIDLTKD